MWEYTKDKYIYAKIEEKHCSVWYDAYIQAWRWTVVALTVKKGIMMQKGKCPTASLAITCAERSATNDNE